MKNRNTNLFTPTKKALRNLRFGAKGEIPKQVGIVKFPEQSVQYNKPNCFDEIVVNKIVSSLVETAGNELVK